MFFDDEGERLYNHEVFHVVHRKFFGLNSHQRLSVLSSGFSVPTHTEDGIPIRKLYVSNLPPKTTRPELFAVFAQYGFIKSCWLRMDDKLSNRCLTPTYAFVTFSNPADAHKALQAPLHEKILRGRNLRISPADSWHQPLESPDGKVLWSYGRREDTKGASGSNCVQNEEAIATSKTVEKKTSEEINEAAEIPDESNQSFNIMDVLNRDCLSHVLAYISIRDLIRSECVSKRWQTMVQEYLQSIRSYKTSWWQHEPVTLTTAVLRRVLQRLGGGLLRLHIDHHWSALNDRTAHTVGKFCPHLEELKIVGMYTKNWNPLIYGCRHLKSLSFVSCNKLTDSSLLQLVKNDSTIESLTVANNTHVTGLFLTSSSPSELTSLSFYNCYSLQGSVISSALFNIPSLTTLKLDVCPITMWKIMPLILDKVPHLEELSLSEYTSSDLGLPNSNIEAFCNALSRLTKLKVLNLSRNIYITDAVLKTVAQSCPYLESLNISSCNSKKSFPLAGVSDEGVRAVCGACRALRVLDVSYVARAGAAGLRAAAGLPRLAVLLARGNPALPAAPFAHVLACCHQLRELDLCGCDNVTEEVIEAADAALQEHPRALSLRLAATAAAAAAAERRARSYEHHKLLTVNLHEDSSNPHLRPDFVDDIFEEYTDESLEDYFFDQEDYDFLGEDDEPFDEIDDYDDVLHLHEALHNVVLL